MSTVSTHVLDTARGRPAAGIRVTLEGADGAALGAGETDADGRLRDLAPAGGLAAGTYRLRFAVEAYLARDGGEAFWPEVIVAFRVAGGAGHYHVPLLLAPYGYATYRGS